MEDIIAKTYSRMHLYRARIDPEAYPLVITKFKTLFPHVAEALAKEELLSHSATDDQYLMPDPPKPYGTKQGSGINVDQKFKVIFAALEKFQKNQQASIIQQKRIIDFLVESHAKGNSELEKEIIEKLTGTPAPPLKKKGRGRPKKYNS